MVREMPIYEHMLDKVKAFSSFPSFIVTGDGQIAEAAEKRGVAAVQNTEPEKGISLSLRLGLEAVQKAYADADVETACGASCFPSVISRGLRQRRCRRYLTPRSFIRAVSYVQAVPAGLEILFCGTEDTFLNLRVSQAMWEAARL